HGFIFNYRNTPILAINHPQILNFTWTQNQTLASSPHFLILSILTYLSLTFILYHTSTSTSPPSSPFIGPHILKPITAVHNLTLLLLSVIMAVGCTLSIILHLPHLDCTLCFPPTISPHPFDHFVKLRPTAHVPPRLPPCNRRRYVLPLVTDEAVFSFFPNSSMNPKTRLIIKIINNHLLGSILEDVFH
ncbi:hypothetical protein CUMW_264530, partial [Citrus unshiu]